VYSEDIIRRVRDSVDIYDVVSGYVSLKKAGKNWLGLCPFHSEKTPSFNVNPASRSSTASDAASAATPSVPRTAGRADFPEAVKHLAGAPGITLPESRPRAMRRKAMNERKALLR